MSMSLKQDTGPLICFSPRSPQVLLPPSPHPPSSPAYHQFFPTLCRERTSSPATAQSVPPSRCFCAAVPGQLDPSGTLPPADLPRFPLPCLDVSARPPTAPPFRCPWPQTLVTLASRSCHNCGMPAPLPGATAVLLPVSTGAKVTCLLSACE